MEFAVGNVLHRQERNAMQRADLSNAGSFHILTQRAGSRV